MMNLDMRFSRDEADLLEEISAAETFEQVEDLVVKTMLLDFKNNQEKKEENQGKKNKAGGSGADAGNKTQSSKEKEEASHGEETTFDESSDKEETNNVVDEDATADEGTVTDEDVIPVINRPSTVDSLKSALDKLASREYSVASTIVTVPGLASDWKKTLINNHEYTHQRLCNIKFRLYEMESYLSWRKAESVVVAHIT
jgi:hypothetical protein